MAQPGRLQQFTPAPVPVRALLDKPAGHPAHPGSSFAKSPANSERVAEASAGLHPSPALTAAHGAKVESALSSAPCRPTRILAELHLGKGPRTGNNPSRTTNHRSRSKLCYRDLLGWLLETLEMTHWKIVNGVLVSTVAVNQLLGEPHDHSHREQAPPERHMTFDLNLCAVTSTTTTPAPPGNGNWFGGVTE